MDILHASLMRRTFVLQVTIELFGRPDLHIQLPFGVDAGMGTAQQLNEGQTLKLMMPYKSYRSFTQVCTCGTAVAPLCMDAVLLAVIELQAAVARCASEIS